MSNTAVNNNMVKPIASDEGVAPPSVQAPVVELKAKLQQKMVATTNTSEGVGGLERNGTHTPSGNNSPLLNEANETIAKGEISNGNTQSKNSSNLMLQLLDEFTKIYKDKLERLDSSAMKMEDQTYMEQKVLLLESWLGELGEQNAVLVSTVGELEREAASRVTLLQDSLTSMAVTTRDNCGHLRDHHLKIEEMLEAKAAAEQQTAALQQQLLAQHEAAQHLRTENANLHTDVETLLDVMTRARATGVWRCDDVTFLCVTPEQVFGPVLPPSGGSTPSLKSCLFLHSPSSSSLPPCGGFHSLQYRGSQDSSLSNVQGFCNVSTGGGEGMAEDPNGCDGSSTVLGGGGGGDAVVVKELRFLRDARDRANTLLVHRDKRIAQLQCEVTDLQQQLQDSRTEAEDSGRLLRTGGLDHRLQQSWQRVDSEGERLESLHSSCTEGEAAVLTNSNGSDMQVEQQLAVNIDVLASRLAEAESECEESRREVSRLAVTCETLQQQLRETRDAREMSEITVARLRDKIKELESRAAELQSQVASNCSSSTRVQTGADSSAQPRPPSSSSRYSPSLAEDQVWTTKLQLSRLENEVSEKGILLRELQGHLATARHECHLKDDTLQKVEGKLESVRGELNEREERGDYLEQQLQALQLQLARTHAHLQDLQQQVESKSEVLHKLERENCGLAGQLNAKTAGADTLQLAADHVAGELISRDREVMEQRLTIGSLQDALVASKQTADVLRAQLDEDYVESRQELDFLRQENAALEDQLQQLNRHLLASLQARSQRHVFSSSSNSAHNNSSPGSPGSPRSRPSRPAAFNHRKGFAHPNIPIMDDLSESDEEEERESELYGNPHWPGVFWKQTPPDARDSLKYNECGPPDNISASWHVNGRPQASGTTPDCAQTERATVAGSASVVTKDRGYHVRWKQEEECPARGWVPVPRNVPNTAATRSVATQSEQLKEEALQERGHAHEQVMGLLRECNTLEEQIQELMQENSRLAEASSVQAAELSDSTKQAANLMQTVEQARIQASLQATELTESRRQAAAAQQAMQQATAESSHLKNVFQAKCEEMVGLQQQLYKIQNAAPIGRVCEEGSMAALNIEAPEYFQQPTASSKAKNSTHASERSDEEHKTILPGDSGEREVASVPPAPPSAAAQAAAVPAASDTPESSSATSPSPSALTESSSAASPSTAASASISRASPSAVSSAASTSIAASASAAVTHSPNCPSSRLDEKNTRNSQQINDDDGQLHEKMRDQNANMPTRISKRTTTSSTEETIFQKMPSRSVGISTDDLELLLEEDLKKSEGSVNNVEIFALDTNYHGNIPECSFRSSECEIRSSLASEKVICSAIEKENDIEIPFTGDALMLDAVQRPDCKIKLGNAITSRREDPLSADAALLSGEAMLSCAEENGDQVLPCVIGNKSSSPLLGLRIGTRNTPTLEEEAKWAAKLTAIRGECERLLSEGKILKDCNARLRKQVSSLQSTVQRLQAEQQSAADRATEAVKDRDALGVGVSRVVGGLRGWAVEVSGQMAVWAATQERPSKHLLLISTEKRMLAERNTALQRANSHLRQMLRSCGRTTGQLDLKELDDKQLDAKQFNEKQLDRKQLDDKQVHVEQLDEKQVAVKQLDAKQIHEKRFDANQHYVNCGDLLISIDEPVDEPSLHQRSLDHRLQAQSYLDQSLPDQRSLDQRLPVQSSLDQVLLDQRSIDQCSSDQSLLDQSSRDQSLLDQHSISKYYKEDSGVETDILSCASDSCKRISASDASSNSERTCSISSDMDISANTITANEVSYRKDGISNINDEVSNIKDAIGNINYDVRNRKDEVGSRKYEIINIKYDAESRQDEAGSRKDEIIDGKDEVSKRKCEYTVRKAGTSISDRGVSPELPKTNYFASHSHDDCHVFIAHQGEVHPDALFHKNSNNSNKDGSSSYNYPNSNNNEGKDNAGSSVPHNIHLNNNIKDQNTNADPVMVHSKYLIYNNNVSPAMIHTNYLNNNNVDPAMLHSEYLNINNNNEGTNDGNDNSIEGTSNECLDNGNSNKGSGNNSKGGYRSLSHERRHKKKLSPAGGLRGRYCADRDAGEQSLESEPEKKKDLVSSGTWEGPARAGDGFRSISGAYEASGLLYETEEVSSSDASSGASAASSGGYRKQRDGRGAASTSKSFLEYKQDLDQLTEIANSLLKSTRRILRASRLEVTPRLRCSLSLQDLRASRAAEDDSLRFLPGDYVQENGAYNGQPYNIADESRKRATSLGVLPYHGTPEPDPTLSNRDGLFSQWGLLSEPNYSSSLEERSLSNFVPTKSSNNAKKLTLFGQHSDNLSDNSSQVLCETCRLKNMELYNATFNHSTPERSHSHPRFSSLSPIRERKVRGERRSPNVPSKKSNRRLHSSGIAKELQEIQEIIQCNASIVTAIKGLTDSSNNEALNTKQVSRGTDGGSSNASPGSGGILVMCDPQETNDSFLDTKV